MAEHVVEGDFKQFVFKMASPEDTPRILVHLRKVFYKEEPLCKLCGLTESDYDEWDEIVKCFINLNDQLNILIEEKSTGKIAGVRLTYKCVKGAKVVNFDVKSSKILLVLSVLETVNQRSNMFERYGIDYYADFLMTSVDPEFQRQGLVTELYKRSIELLRSKGYPICKSVFSSPFTRKAAANLGFEEIARLHFSELKNQTGEIVFPNAVGCEEMFAAVMVLKLNM